MNDIKDAIEIVRDINYWLDDNRSDLIDDYGLYCEFKTAGDCSRITFADITIWDSENDNRVYDETTDSYESLDGFVINEINSLCNKLGKVKIKL